MTTACPTCGSRVARIVYGLVADPSELDPDTELGGCVIEAYSPTWRCRECGREGGCVDGDEDDLPYEIALRRAVGGRVPVGPPRTGTEIGLSREAVARRGLLDLTNLHRTFPAPAPWFVRSYVSSESGWATIEDEPEERFEIGTAVLHAADQHPLAPGDVVVYLGDIEGEEEPVLWAPALVVRVSTERRRRTVWTLTDGELQASNGWGFVRLRSLPDDLRGTLEELSGTVEPMTPHDKFRVLSLFHRNA